MAVVAILSLLTGAFLTLGSTRKEQENLTGTGTHLDEIQQALLHYYKLKGYLPGPARRTDAEDTANFGGGVDGNTATPAGIVEVLPAGGVANNDEVRIGVVPTRTLGLPDAYMFDAWGNRISYAVVKELTKDAATFTAYSTALTTGVIQVTDTAGNQMTESNSDTVVAFVVASHGKDAKGAYNRRGLVPTACGATAEDSENCDDDAVFTDADVNDSTTAATYYYDLARWKDYQFIQSATTKPTPPEEPEPPAPPAYWSQLVTGTTHTCGLKDDGTVWCWGEQTNGQIGNGLNVGNASAPEQVQYGGSNLTDIIQISVGDNYSCALKSSTAASNPYRIFCWGSGSNGQLGDNTSTSSTTPVRVTNTVLTKPIQFDAGDGNSCAVQDAGVVGDNTDNTLYCWGQNNGGEIGDNTTTERPAPVQTCSGGGCGTKLSKVKYVSSGGNHVCAVADTNGNGVDEAWCWGKMTSGKLGNFDSGTSNQPLPVQVCLTAGGSPGTCGSYLLNVMKLGTGMHFTCGVLTTGATYCWGQGQYGAVGDGDTSAHNKKVANLVNSGGFSIDGSAGHSAVDVALSNDVSNDRNYACAIMDDDSVRCWGGYQVGKIGNGSAVGGSQTTPSKVKVDAATFLTNVTSIDAGADHTCAVADQAGDGNPEGYCWGRPNHYRLGNGDDLTQHNYADTGPP